MIIHVTQKHIDAGIRSMVTRCPVALAIESQVPDCTFVTVGGFDCGFNSDSDDYSNIHLSLRVQKFISDFDRDIPVEPFAFHLDGVFP